MIPTMLLWLVIYPALAGLALLGLVAFVAVRYMRWLGRRDVIGTARGERP